MENTEIEVLNLKDGGRTVFLNANQARKYSTYASFVYKLEWPFGNILRAYISDGDVDSTMIDFDVARRKIIREKFLEPDWDYEEIKRKTSRLSRRLSRAFPDQPNTIFDDAIYNNRVLINGYRVLTQIRQSGFSYDVVLYDIAGGVKKTVLEIPKVHPNSFIGGFVDGSGFIFGVHIEDKINIYRYSDDLLTLLLAKPADPVKSSSIDVKYESPEKTIFLLTIGGTGGNRDSATLWLFEDGEMKPISNFRDIYDFDYNDKSKLAVFCFCEDGKRHLSVMRMSN